MRFLTKLVVRAFYIALWVKQRATIGAQVALVHEGNVLLVRHSYKPGWHLPGGGIDPPETPENAVARELREEVAITLTSPPTFVGVFPNPTAQARGDYIMAFRAAGFTEMPNLKTSWEIAETKWFPLQHLPSDCSAICRRIIDLLDT